MYPHTRKQLDDRAPLFAVRDFDGYKVGDVFDTSIVRRDQLSTLWSQHYIDHEQLVAMMVTPGATVEVTPPSAPNVHRDQPRRNKERRQGDKP